MARMYKTVGRAFRTCGFLLSVSLVLVVAPVQAQGNGELILLTWADHLDPEVISEFELAHHVRVREVHFGSDHYRDLLLVENEGAGFDLALVDASAVAVYERRGWLSPVTEESVPNLQHIDPALWTAYPQLRGVAAPYLQGTVGILYRTDLVDGPVTSWMQLFQPVEKLRGRIMMLSDPYDLIGAAMKALGHPMLSERESDLDEAERLLLAQKPSVYKYGYVGLGASSELVTGKVAAAEAFNGDFHAIREHEKNLAYVIPKEGSALWVESWVLLRAARNPGLAARFLDFLNLPDVAARNAEALHVASCNDAAKSHQSREFLSDPLIYPGSEVLSRSERYHLPSARAAARYNEIFYRVIE